MKNRWTTVRSASNLTGEAWANPERPKERKKKERTDEKRGTERDREKTEVPYFSFHFFLLNHKTRLKSIRGHLPACCDESPRWNIKNTMKKTE